MSGRGAKQFHQQKMLLAVLIFASANAFGADVTPLQPQRIVQDVTRAVTERLAESAARLEADPEYITEIVRELVVPHIDFRTVARQTLAESWDELSNGEQRCATLAIRQHLVERYARVLFEYEYSSVVTDPLDTVPTSGPVYVTQTITTPNPKPMPVRYEMKYIDGTWKLVDLIVTDVSLVENYRLSFSYEIEKQGIGDFLRTLPQCRER